MGRAVFSVVDFDQMRHSIDKSKELCNSISEQNRTVLREDKIAKIREMDVKVRLALLKSVQLLCELDRMISEEK